MPNPFDETGALPPPVDKATPAGTTDQPDLPPLAQEGLSLLKQGDQYDGILSLMKASVSDATLPQDPTFLSDLQAAESAPPIANAVVPTDTGLPSDLPVAQTVTGLPADTGTVTDATATPTGAAVPVDVAAATDANPMGLKPTQDAGVNNALSALAQAVLANPQILQDPSLIPDLQALLSGSTNGLQATQDATVNQALQALQAALGNAPAVLNDQNFASDLNTIANGGATQPADQPASPGVAAGDAQAPPVTDQPVTADTTADQAPPPVPADTTADQAPPVTDQPVTANIPPDNSQEIPDPGVMLAQAGIAPSDDLLANQGLVQLLKGDDVNGISTLMQAVQKDPSLLQNEKFLSSLKSVETKVAASSQTAAVQPAVVPPPAAPTAGPGK